MVKRVYFGFSHDRQNWKNSHRKYSKLSKYKIEKILNCFVRDLTISSAFEELSSSRKNDPISQKTIGRRYKELRDLFIYGSLTYLELFGGAGAAALVGFPPIDVMKKIEDSRFVIDPAVKETKVRIRQYNRRGAHDEYRYRRFWLERALREYAWSNLSINQVWVVTDFAIVKMVERKIEREWEDFFNYGFDYVAEKNWSSGECDFGMREKELWSQIYSTNRSSDTAYHDRLMRDMKWLMNRHPLGTSIQRKTRLDYRPSSIDLKNAGLEWFPDGYKQ